MKLSVLLPAYNEAENIRRFPKELVPYLGALNLDYEILVIDDGSLDGTGEVARLLNIPNLSVLVHEKNKGVGASIRTGIAAAKGELLVMLDADLTFHPKYIKDLLERFNQDDVDFVIGSPKLAGWSNDIQLYRRVITYCANLVYSLLFGKGITAVTPIFRLYKTADLKELQLESEKFDITVEILFKLILAGKKYAEVPASLGVRQFGVSKLDYHREIIRHFKIMKRIVRWRIKNILKK